MTTTDPRPRGAVAAGDPRTLEAGLRALRLGGNAIDAAVAAGLTSVVVEPLLTSFGGGGVAVIREPSGRVTVLDFFAAVPGLERTTTSEPGMVAVPVDYGVERQTFHIGTGSITVPGIPAGLEALHRRFGRVALAELAAPAIEHARDGFAVGSNLRMAAKLLTHLLQTDPEAAALYYPGGVLIPEGATLRHDGLAETLEAYARDGAALFHSGALAQRLLDFAGGDRGWITRRDLDAYEVLERAPLVTDYRGATLSTNPPPAAGGVLLAYALGVLQRSAGPIAALGSDELVRLARLMTVADAARDRGVYDRLDEPGFVEELLGEESLAAGVAALDSAAAGRPDGGPGYTTHLSTADAEGWMVAYTSSNGETCARFLPGSGVLLNNFLGEEDLQSPSGKRRQPGARIRTSMTPSILELPDGSALAFGSGGSNRIRGALLQTMIHLVDRGHSLRDAVIHPRIHHEAGVCRIEAVSGFDGHVEALERALGAVVRFDGLHMYFGGVHAVRRTPDGRFEGAGDPRRGGVFGVA